MARLRPIDITLPIWPAARRCIQTKKPMISTSGSSRPAQLSSQFDDGWLKLRSTFLEASSSSSAALTPRSPAPVAVNLSPVGVVPWIVPLPLSMVTLLTWPALTLAMNSE